MTSAGVKQLGERQERRALWHSALVHIRQDKLTLVALVTLGIIALLSLLAPFIATFVLRVDPNMTNADLRFLPMGTAEHVLGTDNLGRDHLARLLYAGQVSLGIGFASAMLSLLIGVTLGILTGFYGGWVDDISNWVITTLNAIPALVLLLIVVALFSSGPVTLTLVLAFLTWTLTTRLVRGETLAIREQEYVMSARALGASDWRIMLVDILPNVFSVTIVTLMINIGNVILIESALSFLGLGVQPPTPSWGNMLSNSQSYFKTAPHLVIFPGLLIMITVLCLYVIGDGLRDAFDPRTVRKIDKDLS
jgi:peptide/nickel transport system permease protein